MKNFKYGLEMTAVATHLMHSKIKGNGSSAIFLGSTASVRMLKVYKHLENQTEIEGTTMGSWGEFDIRYLERSDISHLISEVTKTSRGGASLNHSGKLKKTYSCLHCFSPVNKNRL